MEQEPTPRKRRTKRIPSPTKKRVDRAATRFDKGHGKRGGRAGGRSGH